MTGKTKRAGAKSGQTKAKAATADSAAVVDHPAKQAQMTGDALANVFTGMGAADGRRAGDSFNFSPIMDDEIAAMYRSEWMARKVVDIVAEDMTQEWRAWQAPKQQISDLENAETELNLVENICQAMKYARMFGGGALVLSDGKDAHLPLLPEGVKKDGLKYTFALPRTKLDIVDQLNWRPDAPNFGLPEFFEMSLHHQAQVRIHWSRVIVFRGNPYPDPMEETDCWGDSIYQVLFSAIRDSILANTSGAGVIEEMKVDIVQMENLEAHVATADGEQRLQQRMRLLQLGKSMFKVLLMGGRETYDSKSANLANLDKVMHFFLQVVSGACDIPATRFLAQSPAGMNATGESDLRNYAQMIKAQQRRHFVQALRRIDPLLKRSALGSDAEDVWYQFRPLWALSPKENAEVNKQHSEADIAYSMSGLVPQPALAKAVRNRMIESGAYPGLEDALDELSEAELQADFPDDPQIDPLDENT